MEDGNVVNTVGVDFEPTSVSIHPAKTEFAVGGSMDSTLHVYSLAAGGNLEEKKVGVEAPGGIYCILTLF